MPQPIRIPDVAGKVVALLGLGRTGSATAAALAASGATVWAWDDNEQARSAVAPGMIVDLAKANWQRPEILVMSPGIPHTHPAPHPVAALAKAAGKPLLGDIELLYRAMPRQRYIGITGTNGKSTTTTLIAHILRHEGKIAEAAQVLLSAPRELAQIHDSEGWWVERRVLARNLLDIGDARSAYQVVRDAAEPTKENSRVERHFMAGWIALRFLDDPATAAAHLARIQDASSHPTSLARARYWLGRAAEAARRRRVRVA